MTIERRYFLKLSIVDILPALSWAVVDGLGFVAGRLGVGVRRIKIEWR